MKFKQTIAIDFDGVLNEYDGYDPKDLKTPRKNVEQFLKTIYKDYTIIIFTSREHSDVEHWLRNYRLDKYIRKVTNSKPPAVAYIDDRAVRFDGDYNKTLELLRDVEPYWKKEKMMMEE